MTTSYRVEAQLRLREEKRQARNAEVRERIKAEEERQKKEAASKARIAAKMARIAGEEAPAPVVEEAPVEE